MSLRTVPVAVLALVLAASAALAGPPSQDQLKKQRDEKLGEDWVKKFPWVTDYTKAKEEAKKSGKMIFAYFSRSYAPWGPCKSLESSLLSKDGFKDVSDKVVLMLHMTTHVEGDKDPDLLSQKGGNGFPYLAFLDAEGRVSAQHEGPRTAEGILETLKAATEFGELRKKAEGGDAAAQVQVFEKDLEFSNVSSKEAREAISKMKDLADDKKADYEGKVVGLEVNEVLNEFQKKAQGLAPDDKAASKKLMAEFGRKFIDMKKAGHVPQGEQEMQPFWIFMMEAAEEAKDAALYEEALKPLKDKFGDAPQAKKFFEEKDATLAKLKGGAEKK